MIKSTIRFHEVVKYFLTRMTKGVCPKSCDNAIASARSSLKFRSDSMTLLFAPLLLCELSEFYSSHLHDRQKLGFYIGVF